MTVFEITEEGWAWGQLDADHYVGWLPAEALAPLDGAPTHKVTALRTPVFPGPSIKLPPTALLSFGSRLVVTGTRERFAATDGGFIFAGHLAPLEAKETDIVAAAARFLGLPYLWGRRAPARGRTVPPWCRSHLTACGIGVPARQRHAGGGFGRDGAVRQATPPSCDAATWSFGPGHVGIVEDRGDAAARHRLLHGRGARAPVEALLRIEAASAPVRTVKRLIPRFVVIPDGRRPIRIAQALFTFLRSGSAASPSAGKTPGIQYPAVRSTTFVSPSPASKRRT